MQVYNKHPYMHTVSNHAVTWAEFQGINYSHDFLLQSQNHPPFNRVISTTSEVEMASNCDATKEISMQACEGVRVSGL